MTRLLALAATFTLLTSGYAADPNALLSLEKTILLKGVDGKLDHLALDSKGQRLFVANKPNDSLDVIDLKTGKLVRQIPNQKKVSGVAYAPDLDMVYVGNGGGVCNAFACADYSLVFSAKAPGADNVHYRTDSKMVYVAHGEMLTALDAKAGSVKGSVKLPGSAHGFVLDEKAGLAYTVLTKPSTIAVIDLTKYAVVHTFPLSLSDAGSPIAHDAANGLLFVGCPKKPMVVIFDAKTGKEQSSVEIPGGVDDVHFDTERNRLYASCGDGALVVIGKTGEKYEVVSKLETPRFSRTCAFGDGRVYLGVPKQKGNDGPEIRVYEAKR